MSMCVSHAAWACQCPSVFVRAQMLVVRQQSSSPKQVKKKRNLDCCLTTAAAAQPAATRLAAIKNTLYKPWVKEILGVSLTFNSKAFLKFYQVAQPAAVSFCNVKGEQCCNGKFCFYVFSF